jgi:hypothetical protein
MTGTPFSRVIAAIGLRSAASSTSPLLLRTLKPLRFAFDPL